MRPFRSWLGALNFIVLQWFGVRLARVIERRAVWARAIGKGAVATIPCELLSSKPNLDVWPLGRIDGTDIEIREVTIGWRVLRWIVPLTGWWNDFVWISPRPPPS